MKRWGFFFTPQLGVGIEIARKLWYSKLYNGKLVHLFQVGYTEVSDLPHTRIYSVVIPFLTINLVVTRHAVN